MLVFLSVVIPGIGYYYVNNSYSLEVIDLTKLLLWSFFSYVIAFWIIYMRLTVVVIQSNSAGSDIRDKEDLAILQVSALLILACFYMSLLARSVSTSLGFRMDINVSFYIIVIFCALFMNSAWFKLRWANN